MQNACAVPIVDCPVEVLGAVLLYAVSMYVGLHTLAFLWECFTRKPGKEN
jgi:hypothetical protein